MVSKLNISIDDVSPHPMSSTRVIRQCEKILSQVPDAKFTLFIPVAYWRTIGPTATALPLRIDSFPDFCAELRALPTQSFELAFHGLFHGIPQRSNNDELQDLGLDDALGVIDDMLSVVTNAGLIDAFKRVIRPPAWRMSPDAFRACEERGIMTFALSPDSYAMATYKGGQEGRRVVYYNCCPPDKPLIALPKTEVVYHACEWDRNYLSDERVDELIQFLKTNEFQHVFIEDLADGQV